MIRTLSKVSRCLVSSLSLATVFSFVTVFPAQAQTESSPEPSVSQQLEKLAAALNATQQQVEQSHKQIQQMQAEIDRLRTLLAAKDTQPNSSGTSAPLPTATTATDSSETSEDIDILKSTTAQQQQTKVESSSRFPVRLTGLVLFNSFVNQGKVDQIDLPSSALLPNTAGSNTSTGASLRQTILGLEGTGPVLGGAQTSARVSMDFFGGITDSATSGPAGTVRLRTAAITASWRHDTLEADYDTPLISPLSPDSFATVAQPSLAWSGNLWTWAPQFLWTHSFDLENTDRALSLQLGLLDTRTLDAASNLTQGYAGASEESGKPSYETRLAYSSVQKEQHIEFGLGGLYGRQDYKGNQRVDNWATTADWRIPFSDRLHLSGELYKGRGLGDLGGGAYRNIVTYAVPGSAATYLRALDAQGGWLQWSYTLSSTLNANASAGQDSASGNELRTSIPLSGASPIFFYARNRSIVGNMIFRPWSSIIVSPEYRRLQSWPILGSVNSANIYTLTFGYQFKFQLRTWSDTIMARACETENIPRKIVQVLFAVLAIGHVLEHRSFAQANTDVTVHLTVRSADGKLRVPSMNAPVVIWLSPIGTEEKTDLDTKMAVKPGTGKSFEMVQKDKMFQPHLLVVPTGSLVAFPNRDPFFHNVFSLFNGRRFDLGLYETGTSHSVPFNREGVSYIFCNIHPEMGAVIVSVATPYFTVATQASAQLHHIPQGMYLLKVWTEDATAASLDKASRRIKVTEGDSDAGTLDIVLEPRQPHTDKFGKPYAQHPEGSPY